MRLLRASWVLPIVGPPIQDGWVAIEGGRISAVGNGPPSSRAGSDAVQVVDLGDAAIMPALVNAHTHLELSWLRGRIGPASTFLGWVSGMMRERLQSADGGDEAYVRASMAAALEEMKVSGTGLVGDISNSLAHLDLLDASGLDGVVFHELIKFRATDAEGFVEEACRRIEAADAGRGWRLALAPHAPYSVAPSVYRALAAHAAACARRACRCTSPSRPRKWSSSGGGAAGGPTC